MGTFSHQWMGIAPDGGERSMIDDLTGLVNLRRFLEQLEAEFNRFQRYGDKFVVMLGDLDHFKAINDRFGQAAGDEVLIQFSTIAGSQIRKVDTLGRLGGEEFGVLLPHTTLEAGLVPAERIRQSCRAISIQTQDPLGLSISLGITEVRAEDRSIEDILRRADEALYLAKDKGRNRCEIA